VTPFRTSFGVERDRDVLLVRAVTDAAEGYTATISLTSGTSRRIRLSMA
jgi:o-succinylbenzoate synthase